MSYVLGRPTVSRETRQETRSTHTFLPYPEKGKIKEEKYVYTHKQMKDRDTTL